MKGLFSTFRNPAAHAPRVAWATSRSDALDMLTLASMLHRRLDQAEVRGTAPPRRLPTVSVPGRRALVSRTGLRKFRPSAVPDTR